MTIQGTTARRPWVAQARSIGLLLFGVYLVKTSIVDPLAAARSHGDVTLNFWEVLCAPGITLAGLVTTVHSFWWPGDGGIPSWLHDPGPEARTWATTARGLLILAVCVGSGILAWQWLRAALGELNDA